MVTVSRRKSPVVSGCVCAVDHCAIVISAEVQINDYHLEYGEKFILLCNKNKIVCSSETFYTVVTLCLC